MKTNKRSTRPTSETESQSQWVDLPEIIEALANANSLPTDRIKEILLAQNLPSLTPVLDDLSVVRTTRNDLVSDIATFALMDSVDAKEAFPHHCNHPSFNRMLAWPIPSLIRWIKSCKLKLTIPEDWAHWMKHDFVNLNGAELIYSNWEDTQRRLAEPFAKPDSKKQDINSQIKRVKKAAAYLDMGINSFNKDVRPFLNEIKIGKRGVGFHVSELDQWAAKGLSNSKAATEANGQQNRKCHSSNVTRYGGPDSQHLTESEFEKALAQ